MTQNTFHGKIDRNVVTIGRKNMGKKTDKSTVGLILGFVKRMQEDHIGAYAAQAAYFLIMSFIPFVLVLTALVQYTPLTYRMLRQAILGFVPLNLQDFVLKIIAEVFTKSAAVVPISGLFALWSSGKGMQSLIAGLNVIYHVKETRNWLTNRLYSMLYMFLFVLAIIISLLLLVMGNRIHAGTRHSCASSWKNAWTTAECKDLSGVCCVVSGISRFVQISSKQKGITEKSGTGAIYYRSCMVIVFLFLFIVFYILSEFQQYVWQSVCIDHGYAVAVCVYEFASVWC